MESKKDRIKLSKSLQDSALKLLEKNVKSKKGEKLLIITDRKNCPIFTSISAAASQLSLNTTEAFITSDRQHSSPIPYLKDLCLNSDIIIAVTDKSISHSPEIYEARKNGSRVVSMPGITEDLFIKGLEVDPDIIKNINNKLGSKLEGVKEIKVFSPSGSFLVIDSSDAEFDLSDNGDASNPGSLINVPYGEVYSFISNSNGRLVIDFWRDINSSHRAIIETEKGKIVRWSTNANKYVMNQLNAGECGLYIAEFGIGTNPIIKNPIGNTLSDEKIFGSVHFAFGGNSKRKCPIHEDFVVLQPTVLVDGEELIKRGRFTFNLPLRF